MKLSLLSAMTSCTLMSPARPEWNRYVRDTGPANTVVSEKWLGSRAGWCVAGGSDCVRL